MNPLGPLATCPRCNDRMHLEFPDGSERCNGCDRTPAWCRCQPVKAERKPVWLSYRRAKDLTAA